MNQQRTLGQNAPDRRARRCVVRGAIYGAMVAVVLVGVTNLGMNYEGPHKALFGPALVMLVLAEIVGVAILSALGALLGWWNRPIP